MPNSELSVAPRTVLGKKVAQLRRSGITPANIYGGRVDSTSVQADTVALTHLLRASTRNAIINLNVDGESKPRTVVVRELKRDPVNGQLLHVDFYQVSMTEKMRAEVPVVLTGSSDAVSTYGGILLQMAEVVAIEALPADIPAQFEVDVSRLTELEQSLHVRDLAIDTTRVTLMSDPDVVLARVAAPRISGTDEGATAPAEGEGAPVEGAAAAAPSESSD